MKKTIYKAESRGLNDIGWLKSHHTFSFSSYYNPERNNFGALRVINDDEVAGGRGFDMHPHSDMEIITIPFSGSLKHQDTLGNSGTIQYNEVQLMSAGTGLRHSEVNNSGTEPVKFFQIWVFTREKGIKPFYDQKKFDPEARKNKWQLLVSPEVSQETVLIHQDAWFSLANLDAGKDLSYARHNPDSGLFVFLIEGSAVVESEQLEHRDAIALEDTNEISIQASSNSVILLMEVPMTVPSFYYSN